MVKTSKEQKSLALDDRLEEPVAPDGGWGWAVLIASFFSSVIVDGVCFSYGIFYVQFLDHFGENKSTTAWVGSVLNGTYMIMGPIAGALANRFGCRPVAIAGSLCAGLSFFASAWANDVNTLIMTYGVLGGVGFGLMYLPSIVTVGYYFDKKRAFATGIATCGSGVGAFVFAPLTTVLIRKYSWRGAMTIVAGIVLQGMVLGCMYRPLDERQMRPYIKKWRQQHGLELAEYSVNDCDDKTELSTEKKTQFTVNNQKCKSDNNLLQTERKHSFEISHSTHSLRQRKTDNGHQHYHSSSNKKLHDSWNSLGMFATSLENINRDKHSSRTSGLHDVHNKTETMEAETKDTDTNGCMSGLREFGDNLKKTMDVSMLKDPVFVIYCLSCILCMAGFFVPFIYLPDNTKALGYSPEQAAFLLSILGFTNTAGRIAAGWVSDRPWADCLVINNCALVVGGVVTALCPFCTSYPLLVTYASIFGLCIAAFVTLRSIILVDLLGLERLTSGFGIVVLCQGLTSFVGAPLAGFLFDATGTFHLSFYVAGAAIALAGVICFPLRHISRWQERRMAHKNGKQENLLELDVKI